MYTSFGGCNDEFDCRLVEESDTIDNSDARSDAVGCTGTWREKLVGEMVNWVAGGTGKARRAILGDVEGVDWID